MKILHDGTEVADDVLTKNTSTGRYLLVSDEIQSLRTGKLRLI
jgi:hypothetical protein